MLLPWLHSLPRLLRLTVLIPLQAHRLEFPSPVADQPNRWCVDGQYQVYSYAKFLNDKGVMTQTLKLERRVLMGNIPTMTEIHNLFTRHRLAWTACFLGRYSEELVREFYTYYMATLDTDR